LCLLVTSGQDGCAIIVQPLLLPILVEGRDESHSPDITFGHQGKLLTIQVPPHHPGDTSHQHHPVNVVTVWGGGWDGFLMDGWMDGSNHGRKREDKGG